MVAGGVCVSDRRIGIFRGLPLSEYLAVDALSAYSLVCIDEFELDDPGDTVLMSRLMRELADAFRARDRAIRDAHSASAQARFTAIVVAAIPILVAAALELAAPGAVTGALTLLPTAMMLGVSVALMSCGVLMSHRIAEGR